MEYVNINVANLKDAVSVSKMLINGQRVFCCVWNRDDSGLDWLESYDPTKVFSTITTTTNEKPPVIIHGEGLVQVYRNGHNPLDCVYIHYNI